MQEMYEADLTRSTEIVLDTRSRVRAAGERGRKRRRRTRSAARAAAGALRFGHTVGAAITNRRVLGRTEAGMMGAVGAVLLSLAAIGVVWPLVLAVPIVLVGGWIGLALLVRALDLYSKPAGAPRAAREVVRRE
jgi:cardiolipin synthase